MKMKELLKKIVGTVKHGFFFKKTEMRNSVKTLFFQMLPYVNIFILIHPTSATR